MFLWTHLLNLWAINIIKVVFFFFCELIYLNLWAISELISEFCELTCSPNLLHTQVQELHAHDDIHVDDFLLMGTWWEQIKGALSNLLPSRPIRQIISLAGAKDLGYLLVYIGM